MCQVVLGTNKLDTDKKCRANEALEILFLNCQQVRKKVFYFKIIELNKQTIK